MKKYLLLVFLIITSNIYSQENSDKVYNSSEVDEKPEFVGGMKDFYKFTANNFNIPSEGLNGKIIVEFIIEKDGSITNINVMQDIGFGTAEETIRFLNKCPKWKPGKKDGEIVRTLYRLPITIQQG